MKIIAMYLPQYYRTKENDLWWGEGYTDWTAVKGAEALFEGHDQPRVPLNGNYYDLEKKETMQWQADLMKKYGVDGICMYHYWFKNGRRVLEKPEQNLLQWKDIDMPFCFSWANETWARSWAKIPAANPWSQKYENGKSEGTPAEKAVLVEQDYGNVESWREHFYYLLPFFKDKRYIRIDNKPVFLFYLTYDIHCLDGMISEWRKMARENGLNGLYLIGSDILEWQKEFLDAEMLSEPNTANADLVFSKVNGNSPRTTYDQLWNQILINCYQRNLKTYYQGITGVDTSPRQGEKACLTEHASPERFAFYLGEIIKKSYKAGNELLFLNAWNEWGEGMYLEPDERYSYGYLAAIPQARQCANQPLKTDIREEYIDKLYAALKEQSHRRENNLRMLSGWLFIAQLGVSLGRKLREAGFAHMAIYGMGVLGRHLYKELKANDIIIDYLIDRCQDGIDLEEPVYRLQDDLPETELIVVTVSVEAAEIVRALNVQRRIRSMTIEEVIQIYGEGDSVRKSVGERK